MSMGGPSKRARRLAAARIDPPPPPPDVQVRRKPRRRFPRITEAGVALVALLVSGSAFLINGMLYLRGSDLVLLQPDHFLLYRDKGPHGSDLYLAVPTRIVNAAGADFGDVVIRAEAQVFSGRKAPGVFPYEALIEPVIAPNVDTAVANCPHGARCIPATGFYVIERPARLLDIPGGGSRSEYLSFMISRANCSGSTVYCSRFGGFDKGLAVLRAESAPVIRVVVRFQFDGDHAMECRLPPEAAQRAAIFDYLAEKGWALPSCETVQKRAPMEVPPGLD